MLKAARRVVSYCSGENMACSLSYAELGLFPSSTQSLLALLYVASLLPNQGVEAAVNVRTAFYLERNAVDGVSGS